MSKKPIPSAVGIDVSKAKLDVALLTPAGRLHEKSVANEERGFQALLRWASDLADGQTEHLRFVLEASGGYQEEAARFLFEAGLHVAVVNPSRTSAYAKSQLRRSKTDRTDARLLARFARREQPSRWQPPSEDERELRQMTRGLQQLKKERSRLKNQLGASENEAVASSLRAVLKSVEEQIEKLKGKVEAHTQNCQQLARRSELLESIPGVGRLTAALVMAELGAPSRFRSARQAAAYAGLVPTHHQSGSSVRKQSRLSKVGSSRLRRALYFPAITALRCNDAIKAFGQRLAARGKAKMVIVAAAMRKLLHICYGVLKNQTPFDASLHPGT